MVAAIFVFIALFGIAFLFNRLAAIVFVLTPVILIVMAIGTVKSIYLHKTGQAPPPPKQVERPVDFRSKVQVVSFDHEVIEKEGSNENRYSLKLHGRLRNDSEWKVGYVYYECAWKDTWNRQDETYGTSVWVGLPQNEEGDFTVTAPISAVANRGAVMGKPEARGLIYHRCRISNITPVIGG